MMNKRTKQLWEESQQWNGSDDGRGGLKILESVEKFAELIVQECVGIADEYDGVGSTIVSRIEKHFGVEE
jgi:hypothetical protein